MSPLSLNLRNVTSFTVVQGGPGENNEVISDEKVFTNLQDALSLITKSQAPSIWLQFNHDGSEYKLYPIPETGEYRVVRTPIMN